MQEEATQQVKRPTQGGSNSTDGIQGLEQEVPQIDDVLSNIDALLRETDQSRQQGSCSC